MKGQSWLERFTLWRDRRAFGQRIQQGIQGATVGDWVEGMELCEIFAGFLSPSVQGDGHAPTTVFSF